MNNILEVQNLQKHYLNLKAVDGIDFVVPEGICFGLLGPNGAGKTTTIEIMEGIVKPTGGKIFYKGKLQGKKFQEEAGIQFQSTALQDFLTVHEHLKLFQSFYDKTLPIEELIDLCSLRPFIDRYPNKISGGQRQRLLLAIALVNDPEIIFLDEPTTGLDPQSRQNFWKLINQIKALNKTVLLTTHYMEEAYNLCDQIIIMDHGKIITSGSPDELLEHQFQDSVIELPGKELAKLAKKLPYQLCYKKNGNVEISVQDINDFLNYLLKNDVSLAKIQIRPRTLEDLFLKLTGKDLRV